MQTLPLLLSALLLCSASLVAGQTWYTTTSLAVGRSDHGCGAHEGKVYVFGGCISDQVYVDDYSACTSASARTDVFDPTTTEWTRLADMPRPRYRFAASFAAGRIYVFGGINPAVSADVAVEEVDIYDIATNKWSTSQTLFKNATSDLAAGTIGTMIYIAGGYLLPNYVPSADTFTFNPATQTFAHYNTMKVPRGDLCIVANAEGTQLVAFGGYNEDFCAPLATIEVLDPSAGAWTKKSPDPFFNPEGQRGDAACTLSPLGRMFTLGGEIKITYEGVECTSQATKDIEAYDIGADAWEDLNGSHQMPERKFRFCAATIGNQIFVIGGQSEVTHIEGKVGYKIQSDVFVLDLSSAIALHSHWFASLIVSLFASVLVFSL